MSEIRAQILPVDTPNTAAARITIVASPQEIFDLLADPRAHQSFDGSETIKGVVSGPSRLFLGAKFGMAMKIKVPYKITNTVVEFEEGKKISWCHMMKWTWSYELQPQSDGTTQVTESFDASQVPMFAKWWLKKTGAMAHNPKWMAKSLVRLKILCEA